MQPQVCLLPGLCCCVHLRETQATSAPAAQGCWEHWRLLSSQDRAHTNLLLFCCEHFQEEDQGEMTEKRDWNTWVPSTSIRGTPAVSSLWPGGAVPFPLPGWRPLRFAIKTIWNDQNMVPVCLPLKLKQNAMEEKTISLFLRCKFGNRVRGLMWLCLTMKAEAGKMNEMHYVLWLQDENKGNVWKIATILNIYM